MGWQSWARMVWRAPEAETVKALATGATGFVGHGVVRALPAPRLRLPYYPVLILSYAYAAAHHFLPGRQPQMTPATVRLTRKRMFFDSSKAVRELVLRQPPAREAERKAVVWFREHGYVRR